MSTTIITSTKPKVEKKGYERMVHRTELDTFGEDMVVAQTQVDNGIPAAAEFQRVSRPDFRAVLLRWAWYEITLE